jgi:hypothetical protein
MTLLKRIMWPKKGEEIALYKDGALLVEGEVIYADENTVSVRDKELTISRFDGAELSRGIEDRRIVVKKKARL